MTPVPIVLFVYNRPWHTRQTVEALQKNDLAQESELFIYSDGPKNEASAQSVREVRDYVGTIGGFKKVTVIQREKNLGLAANIIDGVSRCINLYGRVIVLEDDLVTSPKFLTFMNAALARYEGTKEVWHISGWNYPIYNEMRHETFLWKKMNCWGWATWSDRWAHFEKNPSELMQRFTPERITEFDLDGMDNNWNQVVGNFKKRIDTWAVFWHATIFRHDGLCLNPYTSFVTNIGHDGSGVHCGKSFGKDIEILNDAEQYLFPADIAEDTVNRERVKKRLRLKQSVPVRALGKLAWALMGRHTAK